MPITCILIGCGSRSNRDNVKFYYVPAVTNHKYLTNKNELSRKRRELWLAAIKRKDLTESMIKNQRVCSLHFITGKPATLEDENHPDWVPSQNMGHTAQKVVNRPADVTRKDRLDKRRKFQMSHKKKVESDISLNVEEEGSDEENPTGTPSKDKKTAIAPVNLPKENSGFGDKKSEQKRNTEKLIRNATPIILRIEDRKETKKRKIEKETEVVDIESIELSRKTESPQTNQYPSEFSEKIRKFEGTILKLIKEHECLKTAFNNLSDENEVLKASLLDYNNSNEVLKEENEKLKQQLVQLERERLPSIETDGNSSTEGKFIDLTDLSTICAICLHKTSNLQSIHDRLTLQNPTISLTSIVDSLSSLGLCSIKFGNGVNKICFKCKKCLEMFANFKDTYRQSSEILDTYLPHELKSDNPSVEHNYASFSNSVENGVHEGDSNGVHEDDNNVVHDGYSETVQCYEDNTEPLRKIKKPTPKKVYEESSEKEEEETEFVYRRKLIKDKKKCHVCPICFKELKLSQFREHVHEHKSLQKYLLRGPKVPKKIKFYALPNRSSVSLANQEVKEKNHTCPFCPESLDADELLKHVDHHLTNDQFSCHKCGRVFRKNSYLVQHMLMHKIEKPYRCEICTKQFMVKNNYEYHLLRHSYKTEELPYKCEFCYRVYSNPDHLKRHQTIHLENVSYANKYKLRRCYSCMRTFRSVDQLKKHDCFSYENGTTICILCNKAFATIRTHYQHMQLVHNVALRNRKRRARSKKKHPSFRSQALCPVCGLYVKNIYNHRLTHRKGKSIDTPEKGANTPAQCSICNKNFKNQLNLRKHLYTHTGLKPYSCSLCPKSFSVKYNLKVHERVHVGNKCHVCPICQKGFLENSYLNKHLKTHLTSFNDS